MVVPAHNEQAVTRSVDYAPDVVVLDLEYSVPPKRKEAARGALRAHLKQLAGRQQQAFVRIARDSRWADVRAAIGYGITGIVFPGPDTAEEVAEVCALVGAMERVHGVELGTTELVLLLESAQGFWNAAEIAQASPRVTTLGVGRIDLTMQLGPVPQDEFRLYRYLMTRTLVAARMLGKQPLGAHWRPGSRGGVADIDDTKRAASEAWRMGYTGCLCATPEQVAPVNAGYA